MNRWFGCLALLALCPALAAAQDSTATPRAMPAQDSATAVLVSTPAVTL
jgi:hypothetical protein